MYMAAARAQRLWLVQMLDVAFSRRMCCSRVARVRTKPLLPSTSTPCPTSRPGMLRMYAFLRGEHAQSRPAEGPGDAQALPLPADDVGPLVSRGLEKPVSKGLCKGGHKEGLLLVRRLPDSGRSSMHPKKFGDWTATAARSSIPSRFARSVLPFSR